MVNGPFIDDFPIKTTIYRGLSMATLNNHRVVFYLYSPGEFTGEDCIETDGDDWGSPQDEGETQHSHRKTQLENGKIIGKPSVLTRKPEETCD